MRVVKNRVAEIPVSREYIDSDLNTWEFKAYVQISSTGEVLGSIIVALDGYDIEGKPINIEGHWEGEQVIPRSTVEGIKAAAERRALERIESVDFENEDR